MNRRRHRRSNSTSSVLVRSTIFNPDINELILSVSTMLHCQMIRDEDAPGPGKHKFSQFLEERYTNKRVTKLPDADSIYSFLSEVFQVGEFHPECAVILLVYVNRLIGLVGMPLTCNNWKPVTITALVLAQKVWDDNPLANADFSILYPVLNIKQINDLEVLFLHYIQYKLTVTPSLYARYFFELRTICEVEWRSQTVAPLTQSQLNRPSVRSKQRRSKLKRAKTEERLARRGPIVILS